MSRGIANANPGNIRRSPTQWRGQAAAQTDPDFVTFEAPFWGLRALAMTLLSYSRKHGLNTVRGIVNRWAPPSENNTAAYVTDVAQRVGVVSDNPIKVDDPAILIKLVAAIVQHENGQQPYAQVLIANAVDAALGLDHSIG